MNAELPEIVQVDPERFDPDLLNGPSELLRRGKLVVFPTETVYGLGANALDEEAVRRIFAAKGRPPTNPLIVHVGSIEQAQGLAAEWPEEAQQLAEALWPGPLTLVLKKRPEIPDVVTAGLDTVALRMPSHPVALALIRQANRPLAAPSANRYTEVSPTQAEHVVRSLRGHVDCVIDAGPTDVGIESTVVSLREKPPRILRPGMITLEELRRYVPALEPAREDTDVEDAQARPSPGLSPRHYAPRARVIVSPPQARHLVDSTRLGVICFPDQPEPILDAFVITIPRDPTIYARELYRSLHRVDEAGCEVVLVEPPPKEPEWEAIRDRLRRASSD